jgi:hypothetical protein
VSRAVWVRVATGNHTQSRLMVDYFFFGSLVDRRMDQTNNTVIPTDFPIKDTVYPGNAPPPVPEMTNDTQDITADKGAQDPREVPAPPAPYDQFQVARESA